MPQKGHSLPFVLDTSRLQPWWRGGGEVIIGGPGRCHKGANAWFVCAPRRAGLSRAPERQGISFNLASTLAMAVCECVCVCARWLHFFANSLPVPLEAVPGTQVYSHALPSVAPPCLEFAHTMSKPGMPGMYLGVPMESFAWAPTFVTHQMAAARARLLPVLALSCFSRLGCCRVL